MLIKNRRRYFYLINKPFQYGFLKLILVYSCLLIVFLALAFFLPDIVHKGGQSTGLDVWVVAADTLLARHVWVWPGAVVLILLISIHSFRSFWRVAGPLYRFNMVFNRVQSGDLSYPIKIRAKDYLHPEANSLNEMLQTLAEKLERIKKSGEETIKTLEELEINMPGGSVAEHTYTALLGAHRQHLEKLVTGRLGSEVQTGTSGKEMSW